MCVGGWVKGIALEEETCNVWCTVYNVMCTHAYVFVAVYVPITRNFNHIAPIFPAV